MSFYKPYAEYKDSGIEWLGQVPKHWSVKRLRYAATLNPSIRPGILDDLDSKVSFLPMETIGEDGSLDLGQSRSVAAVRNGYSFFENGDVAFAKVTPCFENGKGALLHGLIGGVGFGTSELTVLRPRIGFDARFLNYLIQSQQFRALGAGSMTGAGGLKRVPDEFTRNFEAAWPDLAEQQAIALHLDCEITSIDTLLKKKTRFIELLREKREALITQAIEKGHEPGVKLKDTGVEYLQHAPDHWAVMRLRYAATLNPSIDSVLLDDPDSEVSFLPMEAIGENGSLDLRQTRPVATVRHGYSYFENGDVAFAKVTPCFENGKGALLHGLIRGAGFGTSELTVLRPKIGFDARFLSYLVNSQKFRALGVGAMTGAGGLKRVPDEFTRNFKTAWPPLAEQRAIASHLDRETDSLDTLLANTKRSIDLLKERRAGLISAAVTGQIDLRKTTCVVDQNQPSASRVGHSLHLPLFRTDGDSRHCQS